MLYDLVKRSMARVKGGQEREKKREMKDNGVLCLIFGAGSKQSSTNEMFIVLGLSTNFVSIVVVCNHAEPRKCAHHHCHHFMYTLINVVK